MKSHLLTEFWTKAIESHPLNKEFWTSLRTNLMESRLLDKDFWTNFGVPIFWAALIVTLIGLAFMVWHALKDTETKKETRELDAHKKFADAQLKQALDQNIQEAKAISDIRAQLAELRKLVDARAQLAALEPIIKSVESIAGALATANSTAHDILTGESRMAAPVGDRQCQDHFGG